MPDTDIPGDAPDERPQVPPPPDLPADERALADQPGDLAPEEEPSPYSNLFGPRDLPTGRADAASEDETALEAQDEDREDGTADEDTDDEADDEDSEAPARRPRLAVLIGGLLLLILLGGGIGLALSRWSGSSSNSQTIARVGQAEISRAAFLRNWRAGQDPQATLDDLINVELVVQEAQREGVSADKAKIDSQVKDLREQQGNTDAAFTAFLKQHDIASEADLRTLLEHQDLLETMLLKHITVEQARARHILLAAKDADEIAKRKSEAEDVLKQLQGGADFAKLASTKSDDPGSKEKGGDLGWAPRGVFVPEFDQAIFSMQPNELRLIQTQFGWHIIQLQDAPQVRPLDDNTYMQTPAVAEAFNKTFLPWIKSLRADADKQGQVSILVQPTELVPSPAPAAPGAPAAPDAPIAPGTPAAPDVPITTPQP